VLQLLILERRHAEGRRYLASALEQGHGCIRRRHRHGEWVELVEFFFSIGLRGRDLQRDRLNRRAHRRHRYAVAVLEILDGLDRRVAAVEQEWLRTQGGNAAYFLRGALGTRPQDKKAGNATRADVDIAGDQSLVDSGRPVEREPGDLYVVKAERLGVLFDELLVLHHIELQIAHRKLASETDFRGRGSALQCEHAGKRAHDYPAVHRFPPCRPYCCYGRLPTLCVGSGVGNGGIFALPAQGGKLSSPLLPRRMAFATS